MEFRTSPTGAGPQVLPPPLKRRAAPGRRCSFIKNKLRLLEVRRAASRVTHPQAPLAAQCHRPAGLRFVYVGKSFVPDTVKSHVLVSK
ncbi:hypothetical protein E2C01_032079 [Portunus trituberculatus]|uniref:Uncharacterized protein n=1 Tax=Portunus trituberculatus TaxID=210409 RepID=A0A5B7EV41_PORTR|nr:hypothetical protein [Portunus trituberculatus]